MCERKRTDLPTVSVVMCTYNGARFVREQLDTILAQTYPLHELLVQDDCSTDGTWDILQAYADRHPSVKVSRNAHNLGLNRNFYAALAKASGDFIAVADQDDRWEADKLAVQMQAIGGHLLCAARSCPFSADGSPVSYDGRMPNLHLLRMLYVGTIAGHTFLFPRRLLSLLPPADEVASLRCWDVVLSMTAAAYADIVFVDRILVHQRRYAEANTFTAPVRTDRLSGKVRRLLAPLALYAEVRPPMRRYFAQVLCFLQQLDARTGPWEAAVQMARFQCSDAWADRWRLMRLCVRQRAHLFHVPQSGRGLLSVLRALYFPWSSAFYFRRFSKRYQHG